MSEQLHWRLLELEFNWLTGLFEADRLGSRSARGRDDRVSAVPFLLGATHDATMSA